MEITVSVIGANLGITVNTTIAANTIIRKEGRNNSII